MTPSPPTNRTFDPTEELYVSTEIAKGPAALERSAHARRARAARALTVGISVAAFGGFLGVTHLLRSRRINALDRRIMKGVARLRGPRLNSIVRDVTSLGGIALVTTAAVTGIVVARRSPLAALQIALGGVGGAIGELAIKRYIARPRPSKVEHLQSVSTWSFPSGHAIAASGVYLTLAMVGGRFARTHRDRVTLLTGAGTVASAVAASRVYLGVHYPSDVLGGLAFGTAWACLLQSAFDFMGANALDSRRLALRRAHAPTTR